MVLVRMILWHFRKGKREMAFVDLDHILNTSVRKSAGFRGYISLPSYDDANLAKTLTLWQDEESLKASEKGLIAEALEKLKDKLQSDPTVENYRLFSAVFPYEGQVKGSEEDLTDKFVSLKR